MTGLSNMMVKKTCVPSQAQARTSLCFQRRHSVCAKAAAAVDGPVLVNQETIRMHSATQDQLECVDSLKGYFEEHILPLLTPVEKLWQPADLLPDSNDDGFMEQVKELRERAAELPDELMICLVGDMITEEALPTYMAMLNTLDGVRDETGRSMHPYARWTRHWIAEENRHGDLLNKYLWLTGRVNMKSVENTIQQLIGQGMDPKTENHPYNCFVFTSFQERATKISHGGTARISKLKGDDVLTKVCGLIAADESRHEMAYTRTMDAILKVDPNGGLECFADMMKKKIVMPAHLMDDGVHSANNNGRNLFEDFSLVAEDIGVYTAWDYIDIMEHLIERWNIGKLTGLNESGVKNQEFLLSLPDRFRKLADRKMARQSKGSRTDVSFSWINDRKLALL